MAFPAVEHASSKRGARSPRLGPLSSGDAGPSRMHRLGTAFLAVALFLLVSFGYLTLQGGSSGSNNNGHDAASLGASSLGSSKASQTLNGRLVEQRNLVAEPVTGTAALDGQSNGGDREQDSTEAVPEEANQGSTEGQEVEQAKAEGSGEESNKEEKEKEEEMVEKEEAKEEEKKEEREKEGETETAVGESSSGEAVKGEAGSEGEKEEKREESDEKEESKRDEEAEGKEESKSEEEAESKEDKEDKDSKKREEGESRESESESSKEKAEEEERKEEKEEREENKEKNKDEKEDKEDERATNGSSENSQQEAAGASKPEQSGKVPASGEEESKVTKEAEEKKKEPFSLPKVPSHWVGVKESVPLEKKEMYMKLIKELLPDMQTVRDLAVEKSNKQLRTHAEGALGRAGELAAAWEALGAEKGWGGEERVMGIIKVMEQIRARGQEWRNSVQQLERFKEQVESLKAKMHEVSRERNGLDLAVAKGLPKALFCFNLKLSQAFFSDSQLQEALKQREEEDASKFSDPDLHHYALFSDNVLAAAVVVNSTVQNLAEPSRHVLHLVTDNLNLPAMKAWFAMHPPVKRGGSAEAEGTEQSVTGAGQRLAVEIRTVESFPFLNASYCPVLKQLQAASLRWYYFSAKEGDLKRKRAAAAAAAAASAAGGGKGARELIVTDKGQEGAVAGGEASLEASRAQGGPKSGSSDVGGSSQLKFKNPKYLSMLNHLRFYLPEMYPTLHRVVFLDDDIVVQKDLTPLFSIPLEGNVNAAVFTCANDSTFHRLQHYLNFENPFIKERFDPNACGWAYGMNVFDLDAWREKGLTAVYHDYQTRNEGRTLWKLGTLPPGLMTFYKLTYALDPSWHVLGLGYNREIPVEEARAASVVHYNGNWKPWLDTALSHFKGFWTKYAPVDDELVQQCNIDVN